MAIYDNRVCKTCGRTFSGGPRAWYCPECRHERKLAADLEYHKRDRMGVSRQLGSQDLCQRCGKPYTVCSGLQRFCPECAEINLREVDNRQGTEYYYRNVKPDPGERNKKRREARALTKDEENLKRRLLRKNYPSDVKGVVWDGKWYAEIWHNNKKYLLGRFDSKEDAVAARKNAEELFAGLRKQESSLCDDLSNKQFAHVEVIGYLGKKTWLCRCDCGNLCKRSTQTIKKNMDNPYFSCGCISKQRTKVCPICGKEFTTTGKNQKYCSQECRYTNMYKRLHDRRINDPEYARKLNDYANNARRERMKDPEVRAEILRKESISNRKSYLKRKQQKIEQEEKK